jgi:hypothetical protein
VYRAEQARQHSAGDSDRTVVPFVFDPEEQKVRLSSPVARAGAVPGLLASASATTAVVPQPTLEAPSLAVPKTATPIHYPDLAIKATYKSFEA